MTMFRQFHRFALLAFSCLLLAASAFGLQPRSEPRDLWYTLWIDGVRAGHSRQSVTIAEDSITTSSHTSLAIKRGPVEMSITMEQRFVESHDGRPIWASSEQRIGAMPLRTLVEFKDDGLVVTRTQGETTSVESLALPSEKWLAPAAAERYVRQRLESGATEIVVRTLDPSAGIAPITITRTILGDDTEVVDGKTIKTRLARSSTSYMPGVEMIEEFDLEGTTVRTETPMAGMSIESRIADERSALADVKGGAEVMVRTLIKPDRPIRNARKTTRASLALSLRSGELPRFPSAGAQRVEPVDASTARLLIDLSSPQPASEGDIANEAYLASTLACRSDDELIQQLAARAVKGAGDSRIERAEAMRRFVRSYLDRKSLDVGFASASETARSRSGDCTEHAVLLAAMLRADGIPSRGVTGLVYVDEFLGESGVFGYHMWTQALLDVGGVPTWIDLDAAIDDARASDATHIACAVSTYADSETVEAYQSIIPLMGSLRIKIESIE